MSDLYKFTDADGDGAVAEPIVDKEQGPVVWLQAFSYAGTGCYIPVDRLPEFIKGLQDMAMTAAHKARKDCHVPDCGPCSFDRAIPRNSENTADR